MGYIKTVDMKGNQLKIEFPNIVAVSDTVPVASARRIKVDALPVWERWQVVRYWNGFLEVDGQKRFVGWHTLAYLLDQTCTQVLLYIPQCYPFEWSKHIVGSGPYRDTLTWSDRPPLDREVDELRKWPILQEVIDVYGQATTA